MKFKKVLTALIIATIILGMLESGRLISIIDNFNPVVFVQNNKLLVAFVGSYFALSIFEIIGKKIKKK